MMDISTFHLCLMVFWIAYGFLHSVMATTRFKGMSAGFMGSYFEFYRILYSIFAFISLALILWFQYSYESYLLLNEFWLKYLAYPMVIAGFTIMLICIKKYFYQLSGIKVFDNQDGNAINKLEKRGLHKFVRHPLYVGTLVFIWGLFLCLPYLNNFIAVTIITIYTLVGIIFEERKLIKEFGDDYIEYKKEVPRLIPNFFRKTLPQNK